MRRIIGLVMAMMLVFSTGVMAETGNDVAFEIVHDGSETFTIVVSENLSTGYAWIYTISKDDHVAFVEEKIEDDNSGLIGAPSIKKMTFKVLGEGVSTIEFKNMRSFGDMDVAESFVIMAYQNGDKIFIEEDQPVYALDNEVPTLYDGAVPTLYNVGETVAYNGETVDADVAVQVVDGITMVPLRAVAEAMGYTVTWNNEDRSVEISQGAQWTSIYIGKNAYFRNRMAPHELSSAPVIVNDRTLVPVEFFADILLKSIMVDSMNISFDDFESILHVGYVKEINYDETGAMSITLTSDYESDDIMLQTIIHTNDAFTIKQKEVVEGELIRVVGSQVMTMSIPGQTSGYVIY